MKNKELLIILSQIYILHKKYNLYTRKITLLLEKSKKPEKGKNDTKQKVTTNDKT